MTERKRMYDEVKVVPSQRLGLEDKGPMWDLWFTHIQGPNLSETTVVTVGPDELTEVAVESIKAVMGGWKTSPAELSSLLGQVIDLLVLEEKP